MSDFDGIKGFNTQLFSHLNTDQLPAKETILDFIQYGVESSRHIEHAEDRQELRGFLRFWAAYLIFTYPDIQYPDIDIDTTERRPPHLKARPPQQIIPSDHIAGSLREIHKFAKKLQKIDGTSLDVSMSELVNELMQILPGAIADASKRQRRSQADFLSDLAWVMDHDVVQFRELMNEQALASESGLRQLWVSARHILDLDTHFYKRTVRKNLLDGVRHGYFLSDVNQFERLYDNVKRDRKLGAEHLDQLGCIQLQGEAADGMLLFDFALRNPGPVVQGGRILLGDRKGTIFAPLWDERLRAANHLLVSIKDAALRAGGGVADLGHVSAKVIQQGGLN